MTRRRWTKEEINFLRSNNTMSAERIAEKTNRSVYAVRIKAHKLGISLCSAHKRYSKEEDNYLLENFENSKSTEIADCLGRSVYSVRTRYYILINQKIGRL